MYERESTAVEGSVGVIVVCFLLSCITQDEAGRDFGARCACFSATTCSGGGDLSLSDAIRDWRRGGGGGWGWWVHRRRGQELVALLSGPTLRANPKEFRINGIFAVYKLGDLSDTGT